jgi:hypothetical protein
LSAPGADPPLWRKLAWFAGLWIAGVAAVGLVAGLIRYWLS